MTCCLSAISRRHSVGEASNAVSHACWNLLALAGQAFWPGYLATMGSAPLQMHAHGITATLWLMLLVAQSRLIHSGNAALHRVPGLAWIDIFSVSAFAWYYYSALRTRRDVQLHARYMLGGVFFQFVGPMAAWRHLLVDLSVLAPLPLALTAGVAGAGIAAAGWVMGRAPLVPEVATA